MMLILNLCLSQHTDTCRPHPLILFDTLCLGHLFNSLVSWMCQLLNLCSHTGLFWGHLSVVNVKIRTTISELPMLQPWSEHYSLTVKPELNFSGLTVLIQYTQRVIVTVIVSSFSSNNYWLTGISPVFNTQSKIHEIICEKRTPNAADTNNKIIFLHATANTSHFRILGGACLSAAPDLWFVYRVCLCLYE